MFLVLWPLQTAVNASSWMAHSGIAPGRSKVDDDVFNMSCPAPETLNQTRALIDGAYRHDLGRLCWPCMILSDNSSLGEVVPARPTAQPTRCDITLQLALSRLFLWSSRRWKLSTGCRVTPQQAFGRPLTTRHLRFGGPEGRWDDGPCITVHVCREGFMCAHCTCRTNVGPVHTLQRRKGER